MQRLRVVPAAVVMLALVVGLASRASGQDGDATSTLSVEEARTAVAAADASVEDLHGRLALLRLDRARYQQRLEQRHGRRDRAVRDLRDARSEAQRLAVEAYMGAGSAPTASTVSFAGVSDPLDYTYRITLVRDSTNARYRAAAYYRDLLSQATDAIRSTVDHLDELDAAIATTEASLHTAQDAQRSAAIALEEAQTAEQEAARQAAEVGSGSAGGSSDPPPTGGWVPLGEWPGGPSYAQWAALRQCESSGNYHAVSPSGLYRGAYQFDLSTWQSVGGSGDPALASPAEQDHRAQYLWSLRGASPWPVCGRYLS